MIYFAGILVIGGTGAGGAETSVEFWSPNVTCTLKNYPRGLAGGPTVNLVSETLIGCYLNYCDIFQNGSWQINWKHTNAERMGHSSVSFEDSDGGAILLLGGSSSNSTEVIRVDETPPYLRPLSIRHGQGHCTIMLSDGRMVITGGSGTEKFVTQYEDYGSGHEISLNPMGKERTYHACGVYYFDYVNSTVPVSKWLSKTYKARHL